jgi:hypothetical protein
MTSKNRVLIAACVALTVGASQNAAAATESIGAVQTSAAKALNDTALNPIGRLVVPATYTVGFPQQVRMRLPKGTRFAGGTGRSNNAT